MGSLLRLVGVYEADGGFVGELRYAVLKFTGRGHCSLCEVTHRGVKAKSQWREMCEGLPVPFDLVHLNERSPANLKASEGATPCILAEVDDELLLVLSRDELERCRGDVNTFADALHIGLLDRGIVIPRSPFPRK